MFSSDNGPTCSPLDALLRAFGAVDEKATPIEIVNTLFPFLKTEQYRNLAIRLHSLKGQFASNLSTDEQAKMKHRSVASFIFASNSIENCGTATENETLDVINGLDCVAEKEKSEVLSTLDVLRSTDNVDGSAERRPSFSVANLKLWHSALTKHDAACNPGELRTAGACTYRREGRKDKYTYPMNKYVAGVLPHFCNVTQQLLVLCGQQEESTSSSNPDDDDDVHAALAWFALASFVQFHFVTLHPFRDGNGRMCRILSKLILDCWMPVAVPMFPDKEEYFAALMQGQSLVDEDRDANELFSIEPLFKLLLTTAVNHLENIVRNRVAVYVSFSDASTVVGRVWDDLAARGKRTTLTDINLICSRINDASLADLLPCSSVTVDIGCDLVVTLHRMPAVPKKLAHVEHDDNYYKPHAVEVDAGSEGRIDSPHFISNFEDDFE